MEAWTKFLGLCFGGLKVSIILLSVFLLNIDFLEKKDWWLDTDFCYYNSFWL